MNRVEALEDRLRWITEAREGAREAGQLHIYLDDLDRMERSAKAQLEEHRSR